MIKPRSVYELENVAIGRNLFIVGSGPSLNVFPKTLLRNQLVIALNSSIEVLDPEEFTWWMYADKRITNIYGEIIVRRKSLKAIIVSHQARRLTDVFGGEVLYQFNYQIKLKGYKKRVGKMPYWYDKEKSFLPGRCTILCNALSLACIMRPSRVILVGVDFCRDLNGKFYADGIKRNKHAGKAWADDDLSSGLRWVMSSIHVERPLWPNIDLVTVSKSCSEKLTIPQIYVKDIEKHNS